MYFVESTESLTDQKRDREQSKTLLLGDEEETIESIRCSHGTFFRKGGKRRKNDLNRAYVAEKKPPRVFPDGKGDGRTGRSLVLSCNDNMDGILHQPCGGKREVRTIIRTGAGGFFTTRIGTRLLFYPTKLHEKFGNIYNHFDSKLNERLRN
ncbi:hypothetical protein GWI33_010400 [Rhynchophorus ferrugineus]|uniref:Uncharacterized protein n=1 Tax=Rhynchophorus ferrugineus TaxID=354439 RepID=A0A834IQS8_RHYFE|nr:hypothetical protein GWI33_010400 [Rhynchophorus ferrugineus]